MNGRSFSTKYFHQAGDKASKSSLLSPRYAGISTVVGGTPGSSQLDKMTYPLITKYATIKRIYIKPPSNQNKVNNTSAKNLKNNNSVERDHLFYTLFNKNNDSGDLPPGAIPGGNNENDNILRDMMSSPAKTGPGNKISAGIHAPPPLTAGFSEYHEGTFVVEEGQYSYFLSQQQQKKRGSELLVSKAMNSTTGGGGAGKKKVKTQRTVAPINTEYSTEGGDSRNNTNNYPKTVTHKSRHPISPTNNGTMERIGSVLNGSNISTNKGKATAAPGAGNSNTVKENGGWQSVRHLRNPSYLWSGQEQNHQQQPQQQHQHQNQVISATRTAQKAGNEGIAFEKSVKSSSEPNIALQFQFRGAVSANYIPSPGLGPGEAYWKEQAEMLIKQNEELQKIMTRSRNVMERYRYRENHWKDEREGFVGQIAELEAEIRRLRMKESAVDDLN